MATPCLTYIYIIDIPLHIHTDDLHTHDIHKLDKRERCLHLNYAFYMMQKCSSSQTNQNMYGSYRTVTPGIGSGGCIGDRCTDVSQNKHIENIIVSYSVVVPHLFFMKPTLYTELITFSITRWNRWCFRYSPLFLVNDPPSFLDIPIY